DVAAGELVHRHVVTLAGELQVDPAVHDAFAIEAVCHTGLAQQVDRSLLEHACAHAVLAVLAIARLEHDALDAGDLDQACQRQPGRAGADDPDLCPHSPSVRSKTWNALFAAGTPQ